MRRLTVVLLAAMVVLAVAGGAYGAGKINGKSIKTGTITGKQVKNHSLTKKDFKGSVRGPAGAPGPQGAVGPAGPQGPAGPSALSALHEVGGEMTVAAGGIDGGTIFCPPGEHVISGGFFNDGADAEVFLSYANDPRTGWTVALDNFDSTLPATLQAFAYCSGAGQAVAARTGDSRLRPLSGRALRMTQRRFAAHR